MSSRRRAVRAPRVPGHEHGRAERGDRPAQRRALPLHRLQAAAAVRDLRPADGPVARAGGGDRGAATRRRRRSCASWCARGSRTSSATSTTWPSSPRSATRSSTSRSGSRCARAATRFEAILARLLAEVGLTDRLALFALLGMVNHTATWLKPGGRLTRGRRSPTAIATCCCGDPRGHTRRRACPARARPCQLDDAVQPGAGAAARARVRDRRRAGRRARGRDRGLRQGRPGAPARLHRSRARGQGPHGRPAATAAAASAARSCTPRSAPPPRPARAGSPCACSAHNADARSLYAACGFEVEGVLREFFYLDGRYVDDVLMAIGLTGAGSPAST